MEPTARAIDHHGQLAAKQWRGAQSDGVDDFLLALHSPAQRIPFIACYERFDENIDRAAAAQPDLKPHFVGNAVVHQLRTATIENLDRPFEHIGLDTAAANRAGHASAARYAQARAGGSGG